MHSSLFEVCLTVRVSVQKFFLGFYLVVFVYLSSCDEWWAFAVEFVVVWVILCGLVVT